MCCWVQQEPQLKEARKTEENSALVVSTGEGWSTVPNRLQCFDQQRQRCSLSRKREDQKFSWVRQEPQQRGAMRTEEKSALVVAAGESWSTVIKRLQCLRQQRQRCSVSKKRENKMCFWVRSGPQQREARNT